MGEALAVRQDWDAETSDCKAGQSSAESAELVCDEGMAPAMDAQQENAIYCSCDRSAVAQRWTVVLFRHLAASLFPVSREPMHGAENRA